MYSAAGADDGELIPRYTNHFVLELGPECRWRCELRTSLDNFQTMSEMAFDGVTGYTVAHQAAGVDRDGQTGKMVRFEAAATTWNGPVPPLFGQMDAIWWAFVADCLHPRANETGPGVFPFLRMAKRDQLERVTIQSSAGLRLGPRHTKVFGKSADHEKILLLETRPITIIKSHDIEAVEVLYIDHYQQLPLSNKTGPTLAARHIVTIKKITPQDQVRLVPIISRPTLIDDYRIHGKGRIEYVSTNWLTLPEAAARAPKKRPPPPEAL